MSAAYTNIDHPKDTPYGSGAPFYAQSQGYITPAMPPPRKGLSPWVKFGIPIAVVVVAAAAVGGILATRHHGTASTSSPDSTAPPADPSAAASSAVNNKVAIGIYPTATNSFYMMPIYPSTVRRLSHTTEVMTNTR
jgi:hypothetical protein